MKYILFTCLLSFYVTSAKAQINEDSVYNLTGQLSEDLSKVFSRDTTSVEIIGVNPRLHELSFKMNIGIQKNSNWYLAYLREFRDEKKMPYHENFGLLKEEYAELQDLRSNPEFVKLGEGTIDKNLLGNILYFEAEKELEIFNSFKVNLDSNYIEIKGERLIFVRELSIDSDTNGYKSKWKAYVFETEIPSNLHSIKATDYMDLNFVTYKVMIGQLERNSKYILEISGFSMNAGKRDAIFLNLLVL